jgi:hypothetical protein
MKTFIVELTVDVDDEDISEKDIRQAFEDLDFGTGIVIVENVTEE